MMLVLSKKLPVWCLTYCLIVWLLNYFLGLFDFSEQVFDSQAGKDTGAALGLPLVAIIALYGYQRVIHITTDTLFIIQSKRKQQRARKSEWLNRRLFIKATRYDVVIAGLVLMLSIMYFSAHGLFELDSDSISTHSARYILVFETWIAWFWILKLAVAVFLATRTAVYFINKHVVIRFYKLEKMRAISRLVVTNFAFFAGIIAVQPLFWINSSAPELDVLVIYLAMLAMLYFIAAPVYQIRKILKRKKSLAVERINQAIDATLKSEKSRNRRLVDNDERLQYISDLLTLRGEIAESREWPVNTPFIMRIAFIFSIPMFGWIASSVIDTFIKSFL